MTLENRGNKDKPKQPPEKQKGIKKDQESKKHTQKFQNLLPKC